MPSHQDQSTVRTKTKHIDSDIKPKQCTSRESKDCRTQRQSQAAHGKDTGLPSPCVRSCMQVTFEVSGQMVTSVKADDQQNLV